MRSRRLACALLALLVAPVAADGPAYVLRSVRWEIEGRTREYALARMADIRVGAAFDDRVSLDDYVEAKRRLLVNQRVLETVEIAVSFGEADPGAPVPVDLVVRVKDSWNVIALPYFRFDSNDGLLLSVRARDYDFLGSMLPLRINFNRDQVASGGVTWGGDADFSLPFQALDLPWTWSLDGAIGFWESGGSAQGDLGTTLSVGLPAGPGTLDFYASQRAYGGPRTAAGVPYDVSAYMNTGFGVGWTVPLAELGGLGTLSLRPRLTASGNWMFGGIGDPALDTGWTFAAGVGASFGGYDWVGNFRRGLVASADVQVAWLAAYDALARTATVELAGYSALGWAGPSFRAYGIWSPDAVTEDASSRVRGILDSRAPTDLALVVNLDFPVRVIRFMPAEWFGIPWMRYFQFEQQWSPFVDLSLGHYDGTWFDPADGWYAAGLEVITFPLAMRSLYIRISAGWSIPDVVALRSPTGASPRDGRSIYELFIGFGYHY